MTTITRTARNVMNLRPGLRCLFHVLTLLFLMSMSFSPILAASGAGLKGRVLDHTGASLASVTLRLTSREGVLLSTVSGSDGMFEFRGLPAGDYLLEIEAAGFKSRVDSLKLSAGESRKHEVVLQVAGVDEHLIVTASGTPQSADETSKSVSIVDKEQIERREEYLLAEALRPVPGLRVEQLGGPGAFTKIFIRGLRVVDTSLLIDGLRVRDAADFRGSANPLLEDLLTLNIERIEVLRGSGSSIYGSNAVGGVINIVPEEGAGSPRFEVGFEGGSLGLFRERARISGGVDSRLGYSFSGNRLDVNDGVLDGDVYRNTSLAGRTRYNIRPNIALRGTLTYADGFNRLTNSPFPIGPPDNEFGFATGTGPVVGFVENEVDPDSFRDAALFVGSLVLSHNLGAFGYSASFQSVLADRQFRNGPDQGASAKRLGLFEFVSTFESEGRTDTLNLTGTVRAGRYNLITAGFEAERESFTQETISPFFSTPRTTDRQRSFAFFAQDQMSLLDGSLQLSLAVRTQSFTINNPESVPEIRGIDVKRALTGDGSIAYLFQNTRSKLRAHVGNSFRAPSLSERFSIFRGTRIGNPFLRPERALSVDGGFDQELAHGKLKASATYFYSRLQEVIVSTSLLNTTNAQGALARGFEVSLNASPGWGVDVTTAYTFTDSTQILPAGSLRSDNVRLPAGAPSSSFSIPRHSFSLEVNGRVGRGWNLNFDLYAASEHDFPLFDPVFFSQVITTFEGYTKADLGASYSRPIGERRQVTVFGKIDNLFDQRIVEEGFLAPGATGVGGIRFRF